MTANETDQASRTRSTPPEASAEAASDAPTGNPAQPRPTLPEGMGELDRRAIDTVHMLAMDAVQKAGNGRPGQRRRPTLPRRRPLTRRLLSPLHTWKALPWHRTRS